MQVFKAQLKQQNDEKDTKVEYLTAVM